ncbi:winged helix-turn-helix transcriptional regulator [Brevundimonas guildfordensis]|jgi:DNA-binding HxlR family transcriptional regulator|uniref:Helix-turn-helix transcriptional regulator n=1 Tax=Brevundimonas guildfordensis TaxID=2762241 RepID=A0ABR8R1R2_9CAUL|nr:helix-turn-helix domain-containing protein [Brevundimonas guildfordensis]MBD7941745.1 helix-turn-helix transcriptional regulator [Brevundimonas guildfordensis]
MKLEKVTTEPLSRARRYHDACGAAHGLDLVGERWALLVIRELMMGPRRFSDLRKDLCGVSANVLTQRLEGLEASGILRRRKLPPPASVQVYELTDWGYEIEPVFMVLGRWAARSPQHDPALPISAVSIMQSFKTMFDADRARGATMRLGFALDEDRMVVTMADGRLDARRGEVADCEVIVRAPARVIAAAVYGKVPLEALEADGAMVIEGRRATFERFVDFFRLPQKAG